MKKNTFAQLVYLLSYLHKLIAQLGIGSPPPLITQLAALVLALALLVNAFAAMFKVLLTDKVLEAIITYKLIEVIFS